MSRETNRLVLHRNADVKSLRFSEDVLATSCVTARKAACFYVNVSDFIFRCRCSNQLLEM